MAAPEALGNYRVTSGQGEQAFEKGFSVNPSRDESVLDAISTTELTAMLGEGNFAVARTADELRQVMGDVRIGRELFPWLMPFIVLVFASEHLLANRFYSREGTDSKSKGMGRDSGFRKAESAAGSRQSAVQTAAL